MQLIADSSDPLKRARGRRGRYYFVVVSVVVSSILGVPTLNTRPESSPNLDSLKAQSRIIRESVIEEPALAWGKMFES